MSKVATKSPVTIAGADWQETESGILRPGDDLVRVVKLVSVVDGVQWSVNTDHADLVKAGEWLDDVQTIARADFHARFRIEHPIRREPSYVSAAFVLGVFVIGYDFVDVDMMREQESMRRYLKSPEGRQEQAARQRIVH